MKLKGTVRQDYRLAREWHHWIGLEKDIEILKGVQSSKAFTAHLITIGLRGRQLFLFPKL
jgi:hypothetical protein